MGSRIRRVAGVAALLGGSLAATVGIAAPALADESGCNGYTCIEAYGSGSYLDHVSVRGNSWEAVTFYGHYEVWGPGFHFNTPDKQNGWAQRTTWYIRRNIPTGQGICSRAWVKNSNGTYTPKGLPCVYAPL